MSHIATPHVCVALRGSGSGVGGPSAALLYGELTWCRRLLTYGFHPHTQGSLLDLHYPSSPLLRAAYETWWHVHADPLPSALLNSVTYARVKATVSRSRIDIGSSQTLTVGLNQCDGCVRPTHGHSHASVLVPELWVLSRGVSPTNSLQRIVARHTDTRCT